MFNRDNKELYYIAVIAFSGLIAGWEILSRLFGNNQFTKSLNFAIFGCIITLGDIYFRTRHPEPFTLISILDSRRGGAFGWLPCWIIGLVFIGTGIAFLIK